MDWNQIWTSIQGFLTTTGWQIVEAILALIFGLIIIKILFRIIKSALKRSKMDTITQSFINSIIKYALYIVLWIIVLQILGVPATTFIALLSTLGLAIGLSLKDSLSNLSNGIIIITTKPFKENDYIQISGIEGRVKSIQILTTTVETNDKKEIILPNSEIVTKIITNYSASNTRRVEMHFLVAYESDPKQVFQIIKDAIYSDGRTLQDPTPFVVINELKDDGIDIFATCWVDNADYWDVYWNLQSVIFSEFNRHNIVIPYKQVEVRMRNDERKRVNYGELPERIEKVRELNETSALEDIFGIDIHKIKQEKDKLKNKIKKKKAKPNETEQEVKLTTANEYKDGQGDK